MSSFKKKNIIFISMILILNMLLVLIFKYKDSQKYIQELSNQLYSTNSIEFIDSDFNKHIDLLKNEKNYRIFIEFDNTFRFFKSYNEDWSPPILSGKFFSSEMKGNNAVVGKDLIENIEKIDGLDVIRFNNEYYNVVGIMGESFQTRVDSLVLLNSDMFPRISDSKIVIDSDSKKVIKRLSKRFLLENDINLLEKEDIGLNKLVKSNFFSSFFVLMIILIVIFSVFVYTRYWFEKEIRFLEVLNIFGFRRKKIMIIYLKNILLNVFISGLLILFMSLLFKKLFILKIIIVSFLFISLSIILSSLIYFILWNKYKIE